jgi:lysophospholipase L1-like esterase
MVGAATLAILACIAQGVRPMRSFPAALFPALCLAVAAAEPAAPEAVSLTPFWSSEVMEGESVLFVKAGEAELPQADVFFEPTAILSVRSSSGETTYTAGQDYVWTPGTRQIRLPAGSRITFKVPGDLRRAPKTQAYALTHRDGNGEILFGGGHEYHDMQTVITYRHAPGLWTGPVPAFAGASLPHTLGKLTAKQALTIALLGDSISTGCNASGWAKVAPFQPPYQDLLVRHLETVYGAKVTLANVAVGGTGSAWGVETIGKVIEAKPDLVILAFGMNDCPGRLAAADYQANLKAMMDAVRQAQPEAEFILVATMLGNADWVIMQPELFPAYRDALAALCGPGVVLADMTSVWTALLKVKKDWDMTGNGVNHPNDFGHRLYAQVLAALLVRAPARP